ncbi:hypothetical protein ALQ77_05286 [Pseudomonas corrugata]|uniref:Uncharacterized protein n=1 Tax=Pseudomonas corrugata TaxID=47879 RepID=A0A3M3E422_9PSED|nr:hypothetical protein ALQ77_05286 [Pseudomonas corrugata]
MDWLRRAEIAGGAVEVFEQQLAFAGGHHVEAAGEASGGLLQSVHQGGHGLAQVGGDVLRIDAGDGLGGHGEVIAFICHGHFDRIIGAGFVAQEAHTVPGQDLIGIGQRTAVGLMAVVEQCGEQRQAGADATATLSQGQGGLFMVQQFAEVAVGFVHQRGHPEPGQSDPHRQGIDEHPQRPVGAHRALQAAGDHGAEHHIVTVGAASEHLGPGDVEQHGWRDAGRTGLGAYPLAQGRIEAHAGFCDLAAVTLDIQHTERCGGFVDSAQALAEIGFMGLRRCCEDLCDEFPIRHRRRQAVALALQQGLDFFEDDAQGHMIADHVVVEQGQQAAFGVRNPGDAGAHQRCLLQVQAQMPGVAQTLQLSARVFIGGQGDVLQRQRGLALHHLYRLRLADPMHGAAQDVVAVDHLLQGTDKGFETRVAVEFDQRADQVRIAFVSQQMMEQDALLQRGQRVDVLDIGGPARYGGDDALKLGLGQFHQGQHVGGQGSAAVRNPIGWGEERRFIAAAQGLGHFPHAGSGEHGAHAGAQAMLAQAVDQAHGQQRMPAEFEEAVMTTYLVDVQQVLPDVRNDLFDLASWCLVGSAGECLNARRGQGAAVEFAVGGQRQRFKLDEGARHHVLRQRRQQRGTQLLHRYRLTAQVGDQALAVGLTRFAFLGDHHRFADTGAPGKHGFDLPQFHAETADLHLIVVASQVLQGAVGAPAAKVAGLVQACVRIGAERVGDETLGGQLVAIEVAASDTDAADVNFPGDAHGDQVAERIQHVQLSVAQRLADGTEIVVLAFHAADRGVDRGFGRAVGIEQRRAMAGAGEPLAHGLLAHRFATDHELTQANGQGDMGVSGDLLPEHGRQVGDADCMLLAKRGEGSGAGDPGIAAQYQGGAGQQGAKDLFHRHVEGHGGELQDAILAVEAVAFLQGTDLVAHRAVFEHHAFRLAGGAGGVHDVGQVPGGQALDPWVAVVPVSRIVEQQLRHVQRRQLFGHGFDQVTLGEQDPRRAVVEHVLQAVLRIVRVQRHVGAAGLENGQDADDHFRAALHQQGDPLIGAQACGDQAMGDAVGPGVEFGIAETDLVGLHSDGLGACLYMLLEPFL